MRRRTRPVLRHQALRAAGVRLQHALRAAGDRSNRSLGEARSLRHRHAVCADRLCWRSVAPSAMRRHHARLDVARVASLRDDRASRAAQRNRELVSARQLFEVAQRELLEELWRRTVKKRTSNPFAATNDVDQAALVQ